MIIRSEASSAARSLPRVVIISPASAAANNGNWRTAERWQSLLAARATVTIQTQWDGVPCDLLIALHARRSADSIERFRGSPTTRDAPLVVVLTGTDVYRDIRTDPRARASLDAADRLVVLQPRAVDELNDAQARKTVVIYQSAPRRRPLAPRRNCFDCIVVGHVRPEKDPLTALRAIGRLDAPELRLRLVGRLGDDPLSGQLRALAASDRRIELLGERDHRATLDLIARARMLLLPSLIEGGANVLIEAVRASVPVLASRIGGSIGMLGDDYPGYFDCGDADALARLIGRGRTEPNFLSRLRVACAERAALFTPRRERTALCALVSELTRRRHASAQTSGSDRSTLRALETPLRPAVE